MHHQRAGKHMEMPGSISRQMEAMLPMLGCRIQMERGIILMKHLRW